MAGSNLSGPRQQATGRDAVTDYLAAVAAQLTGPPSARAAVTDELRDGLMEALETHQARGCSPQEATVAAIAEFGDPDTGRRRVRAGAWRGAGASGGSRPAGHRAAGRADLDRRGRGQRPAAMAPPADRPMAGAPAGRPGPGGRRSSAGPDRRRHRPAGPPARPSRSPGDPPPTAAAVAALAAVVADLTLLGIITGHALTSPGSYMWAPVIVAAGASLTRVTLAGRAAHRCLATRAALT